MARRKPPASLIGSGLIPPEFQDQFNAAQEEYDTQMAGFGRQERNLFQDFGFQGGIDESGNPRFEVDPRANFGQYQMLLRGVGDQIRGAKVQRTGRGLGKRGLARARENLIRFLAQGDKANLFKGLQQGAGNIFGGRAGAIGARNRALSAAERAALAWWDQNGPSDPDPVPAGFAGPNAMPGFNVGGVRGGSVGSTGIQLSPETAAAAQVNPYIPTTQEYMGGLAPDPFGAEPNYQTQPGQSTYQNPEAQPGYQSPTPSYMPQIAQPPMVYDPYVIPQPTKRKTAYAE